MHKSPILDFFRDFPRKMAINFVLLLAKCAPYAGGSQSGLFTRNFGFLVVQFTYNYYYNDDLSGLRSIYNYKLS